MWNLADATFFRFAIMNFCFKSRTKYCSSLLPQPTRVALTFPFFPSSGAGPGVAASSHLSLPPSLVWPEFTLVLPGCAGPWTSPGTSCILDTHHFQKSTP